MKLSQIDFSSRAQFANYSVSQLGWIGTRYDPRAHPDLLVPFSFTSKRGQTVRFSAMHKLLVPIYNELFRRLDAAQPHLFQADTDEGCFNPASRTEGGDLSFHVPAIAVDIEWRENPMGGVGPHTVPDNANAIGRPLMIQWGGSWTGFKDYMHFEFHGTPRDAIDLGRQIEAATREDNPLVALNQEDKDTVRRLSQQGTKAALEEFFGKDFMKSDVDDNGKPDKGKHPFAEVVRDEVRDQLREAGQLPNTDANKQKG